MNRWIPFVSILLLIVTGTLSAGEWIVTDIIVNGNSRTRYDTVLEIIDLEQGMVADDETAEVVRQKLLEAGIFQNDMTVNLRPVSDQEAVLTINLADRWTLLPVPAGFVSSDSWLAGAVFIESNIAGLNQLLIAGGFVTNNHIFGFATWNNPSFLGTDYSLGLNLSGGEGIKEHLSVTGDNVLASIKQTTLSTSIRFGRTYSSGFGWIGSTGFLSMKSEEGTEYLTDETGSWVYWQNSLNIGWNNLYHVSFFNKGVSLSLGGNLYTDIYTMKAEPVIQLNLSYNLILADRHLLRSKIMSGWQNRKDTSPLFLGGTEGSRALPSGDVAVRNFLSGVLMLEPVIFSPGWGIFTLPVYYEAGIFNPLEENKPVFWNGPGIGFRFYIDKVAIPALGADFTWNIAEGTFKVAVSIGGSGGGM